MEQTQIVEVAKLVLLLLGGAGSTVLIDWLKAKLNLSGNWALVVTAAVATLIAIATLIVEGQLMPGGVSWGDLPEVFTLVFVASQAKFRMLRDRLLGQQVAEVRVQAAVAQQLAGDAIAEAQGITVERGVESDKK